MLALRRASRIVSIVLASLVLGGVLSACVLGARVYSTLAMSPLVWDATNIFLRFGEALLGCAGVDSPDPIVAITASGVLCSSLGVVIGAAVREARRRTRES